MTVNLNAGLPLSRTQFAAGVLAYYSESCLTSGGWQLEVAGTLQFFLECI